MRPLHRRALPAISLAVALCVGACVPSEKSAPREVDDGVSAAGDTRPAPVFPDVGNVAPELVTEGLVHDFTSRPLDQSYWSPGAGEARCAAEKVVATIGSERLVGLGYRPGVAGASLNDVELAAEERAQVVEAFEGCVDMVEGLAAMLYGAGRMPTRVATCVARGMGQSGATGAFVEAWASGGAVDPFANDSEFARSLLGHAEVCIPEQAFNWPHVRLPESDPLIDSDLPAGSSRSAYVDDRADPAVPDATAPVPTAAPPASQP